MAIYPIEKVDTEERLTCHEYGSMKQKSLDLPLEVITLLDVFARIEARRQAKLREDQKEVS